MIGYSLVIYLASRFPEWSVCLVFCLIILNICIKLPNLLLFTGGVMFQSLSSFTLATPGSVVCQGSSVHRISQVRILGWVAIPSLWVFLTQGSDLGLLHYRWVLYQLIHQGSTCYSLSSFETSNQRKMWLERHSVTIPGVILLCSSYCCIFP